MNKKIDKNKPHSELVSATGGIAVEVEYQEFGPDGQKKKESITVRELSPNEMLAYFQAIDFEGTCGELYCAREKGWADTITRESLTKIIEKGEGLNLAFLGAWRKRQFARQQVINPILIKAIWDSLKKSDTESQSPSSSSAQSAPAGNADG